MIISLGALKIWIDTSPQIVLFLTLLAAASILIDTIAKRIRKRRVLHFGNLETLKRVEGERRFYYSPVIIGLRFIIIALLFLIATDSIRINFAKPVANADFVIAMDVSPSMLEDDFPPTRLDAAKAALIDVLRGMPPKARVSLIRFAGKAEIVGANYTNPLKIATEVKKLSVMDVAGTAIGDAILTSATLLKSSNRTKIMILITDGENNKGVNVTFAAEEAARRGIRIYAVGIVPKEVQREERAEKVQEGKVEKYKTYFEKSGADIKTLEEVAKITGGRAFTAKDVGQLKRDLESILVKSEYLPLNTQYYVLMFIIVLSLVEMLVYAYFGVV